MYHQVKESIEFRMTAMSFQTASVQIWKCYISTWLLLVQIVLIYACSCCIVLGLVTIKPMSLSTLCLVEVNMFKPNTHKGLYKDFNWKHIGKLYKWTSTCKLSELVSNKYITDENILLVQSYLEEKLLEIRDVYNC